MSKNLVHFYLIQHNYYYVELSFTCFRQNFERFYSNFDFLRSPPKYFPMNLLLTFIEELFRLSYRYFDLHSSSFFSVL